MAVHYVDDQHQQTDPAPLLAVSAAARWTQSLAARARRKDDDIAVSRPEAYRHLWQPGWRKPPARQALGRPYVWDGGQDGQPAGPDSDHGQDAAARPTAGARPQGRPDGARPQGGLNGARPQGGLNGAHPQATLNGADALTLTAVRTERAVIGDDLRQLAVWCQIGACITRHTDVAALGEADVRSTALASGWCLDAFGRFVCPSCQQRYPVWSARPPALRGQSVRRREHPVAQHGLTYHPGPPLPTG